MSASSAESAVQLPWLAPSPAALAALARFEAITHPVIASDPAAVLLLLRQSAHSAALQTALAQLREPAVGVLDRQSTVVQSVLRCSHRYAAMARLVAERSPAVTPDQAWTAGLLIPFGWLALAAVDPMAVGAHDTSAIARRLVRRWQLPAWVAAIAGHLDLPVATAPVDAADQSIFVLAQAAAALANQHEDVLRIAVGTPLADSLRLLGFDADDAAALESDAVELLAEDTSDETTSGNPYAVPLLLDLLQLALANAGRHDSETIERLEREVDRLHQALVHQRTDEDARLRERKLSALAEFAAGAGHEINNPLAVISGQAQYSLAAEDDSNRHRSLHTIVQQAQRIHQILTDLMQYARPAKPQKRLVDVRMLARNVATTLHDMAALRQVRIEVEEPDEACVADCDPRQLQTALGCLLRNAIESALADGWARLGIEGTAEQLRFVIEDSGPGPTPAQAEHMFDPFYSGRHAGRGCGLGLPTAWRLAREQGGDVAFTSRRDGPTTFVLTLPRVAAGLMANMGERMSA